jgi:hypothetical protein
MTAAVLDLPESLRPAIVLLELQEEIRHAVLGNPRSLQQIIGPSELGTECTRALLHKLVKDQDPRDQDTPESLRGIVVPGWAATVGTAVHAWLADAFTRSPLQFGADGPRYLVEHRVNVGSLGGEDIWGSSDLFDTYSGCVVDWKVVGVATLNRVRVHGPSGQYRSQAHSYGRGFVRAGYRVNNVMIFFLPAGGDFSKRYVWHEPYDESVALQALARCKGLLDLVAAIGIEAALSLYPTCTSPFCSWCQPPRSSYFS